MKNMIILAMIIPILETVCRSTDTAPPEQIEIASGNFDL
jgi:hypothetical protein